VRLWAGRDLDAALARYENAELTYTPVGATAVDLPPGYEHNERRIRIGAEAETFSRAADAVLTWEMHRRAGLVVAAEGPAVAGRTVVLGAGVGVKLLIPCRVVYVVDEPTRRGFAYGTLSGHPEQGEEAFVVTRDDDETVWFEIKAFSRPGALLVRLAGPVGRAIQSLATTRYERALVSAVATQPHFSTHLIAPSAARMPEFTASTPEEIALHGWADYPEAHVRIVRLEWESDDAVYVITDTEPHHLEYVYCVRGPDGRWREQISGGY